MKPHKQLTIVLGIIELDERFLLLRKVDTAEIWDKKWEFPGGKIEPGESVSEALTREIQEETGLVVTQPKLIGAYTYHWDHPDFTQQTFILLHRVQAGSPNITLNPTENDDYKWVTLEDFYAIPDHLGGNPTMIRELYEPIYHGSK